MMVKKSESPFDFPEPKVFIPEVKIHDRIRHLAHEINHDYGQTEVTAICILKGSFVFYCDLIRYLEMPLTCEFLGLSSYHKGTVSSGEVKLTLDLHEPVDGKHLLIIED